MMNITERCATAASMIIKNENHSMSWVSTPKNTSLLPADCAGTTQEPVFSLSLSLDSFRGEIGPPPCPVINAQLVHFF